MEIYSEDQALPASITYFHFMNINLFDCMIILSDDGYHSNTNIAGIPTRLLDNVSTFKFKNNNSKRNNRITLPTVFFNLYIL